MMKPSSPSLDGVAVRCRVRKATSTAKLDYGEPQDMVATIVNWGTGSGRQSRKRSGPGSPLTRAKQRLWSTGPCLYFHPRSGSSHTLEACCSLNSVDSCDSLNTDDNIKEEPLDTATKKTDKKVKRGSEKKKKFSVRTYDIKTVEKTSSLFRGYRIYFATGSKGCYDIEFENKNGCDIMMAFLQATLPPERFVAIAGSTRSVDGSDTASYLSSLDIEKLTERLAESQNSETMSEKLRKGVGQVVSSMEEMSNSFCGNVCCNGQFISISPSVAPYTPSTTEMRDSPPRSSPSPRLFDAYPGPVMEIDEERSTTETIDSNQFDILQKRIYFEKCKLPSGLSLEFPPESSSRYVP